MIIDKSGTILEINRVFPAPRTKVFAAWTEPEYLKKWWAPKGATTPLVEVDLRVGGRYRFGMKFPDMETFYVSGEYREVSPPECIAFTWQWEKNDVMSVPTDKITQVRIEFHEKSEGTEVILRHEGFPDRETCENHHQGWSDFFEKVTDLLQ